MGLSCHIEVTNLNQKYYNVNTYFDFKDEFELSFLPTFNEVTKFEIALTSFTIVPTSIAALKKEDQEFLTDGSISSVIKVCLKNYVLENSSDQCVYNVDTTKMKGFLFKVKDLIYFPINLKYCNIFHIQLKTERDILIKFPEVFAEDINFSYTTVCCFHLRPMSLFDTKTLTLKSFVDNKTFVANTPIDFSTVVSNHFHQDEDFTLWEVALKSVFLSKTLAAHFRRATVFTVGDSNIPFFTTSNRGSNVFTRLSFIYRIKPSMLCFENENLIFYPVTKRRLDELSIKLDFYNGLNLMKLDKVQINENMYSVIILLFRRKIQL
jgi:hypothetical protein